MKRGIFRIIFGIALIVVQFMSILGSLKTGTPLPTFYSSGFGLLYDMSLCFGYYLAGIVGIIVFLSGAIAYTKQQNEPNEKETYVVAQSHPAGTIQKTNQIGADVYEHYDIKRSNSTNSNQGMKDYQMEGKNEDFSFKFLCIIAAIVAVIGIVSMVISNKMEQQRELGYKSGYAAGNDDGFEEGYEAGYETGYEDGYSAGHSDGYKEGYNTLKPVTMPKNGEILDGKETKWASSITVTAGYGSSHVVSLKTANGQDVVTFFVRSGSSVTIGVPRQKMYVYFASGKEWYGFERGKMFGENTSYTKDRELLDFSRYTFSYTLHPVSGGNFSESPSSAYEFF